MTPVWAEQRFQTWIQYWKAQKRGHLKKIFSAEMCDARSLEINGSSQPFTASWEFTQNGPVIAQNAKRHSGLGINPDSANGQPLNFWGLHIW